MHIGGSTVKDTPNGNANGHRSEAGETPKDDSNSTDVPTIEAIRDLIAYSRELVVSVLLFEGFDRELIVRIVQCRCLRLAPSPHHQQCFGFEQARCW